MTEYTDREGPAAAQEQAVPLTRLLAQRWYTLDQPWTSSDMAGTLLLAGSPDPHLGVAICDTAGMEDVELHEQQAIAQHIVDLHNASLSR